MSIVKGRLAWLMVPHLSGMSTLSHLVSCGLRSRGWEVTWVGVGEHMISEANDAPAQESWEKILPRSRDVAECAVALASWVREQQIDAMIAVGNTLAATTIPLLPSRVRRIFKCQSMTRHAYRLTTAHLDRTDLILVETPRQFDDLTKGWQVPEWKCALIPNGVEESLFIPPMSRDYDLPLRMVYVGRLDNASKNVLLLPKIAARLVRAGLRFRLAIVGDGPERDHLRREFDALCLQGVVRFLGPVTREQVVSILQQNSVLLLPSRFEGMPWSILESMACGCVPIASRIARTTDAIIRDGENGLLCRIGDAGAFATAVATLASDRRRLESMSLAARKTIEERFTVDRMIDAHDRVFMQLLNRPHSHPEPVSLSGIPLPGIAASSWRGYVPRPVKNLARTWAERFRITV